MTLRRRQNEHESATLPLWLAVATALTLTCLFGAGCASSGGQKSSREPPLKVTVLTDSIEPLRQQFNADKDKLRVLALFSPT
jgi:hypothetical protein